MRYRKRNRYPVEPYTTTAKFCSNCAKCGEMIKRGTEIIIWSDRKAYHYDCMYQDYKRFREEKFDEMLINASL